ncbi:molybdenum ABC transporter ATP-binding protein ModC [Vibrio aphrogenes]|uniref:molybdenum ABC transporter ATP-binding protein ModC n=1 Tax=Vibrio aphrogenes TaxID=1891186 RepID=UPI000B3594C1|nr:molybdenum ABC transporter ATP-binding protein ModC [Vibrio aphrogenes]
MIELHFKHQFPSFCLDIDTQIPDTGITAIFGRSGAGKTSIINAISGLQRPDSGVIAINDTVLFDSANKLNLAIEKRHIGYVFQEARLFPHYRVKGNLLYGYSGKGLPCHFKQVIELLGIEHLLERYPADLSGGEKQRCAIARALLSEPKILLMDEPLASLDLPRKQEVMPFLENLAQQIHIPILYVTHSLDEILHLADHMLLMQEGQVIESGDIEQVWCSEAFQPWQQQHQLTSLFKGQVKKHHPQYALTYVEIAPNTGVWMSNVEAQLNERVRVRIHANDVSLTLTQATDSSIRNIIPAIVAEIKTTKDDTQPVAIRLSIGDSDAPLTLWATVTAWARDELNLCVGLPVYAQIKGVKMTNQEMASRK